MPLLFVAILLFFVANTGSFTLVLAVLVIQMGTHSTLLCIYAISFYVALNSKRVSVFEMEPNPKKYTC